MKHFLLLFCFLFSAQLLCAQKTFKKKNGKYSFVNGDGNRESGIIKNHLAEGEWLLYYSKTKTLKSKTMYQNGHANGKTEEYNEEGKLVETGYYKDGYADSTWKKYYSTGEISEIKMYSKGKLHGESRLLGPDGVVFRRYVYNQNAMIAFEAFDNAGKPLSGEYYRNGEKFGRCWNTMYWKQPDSLHRNYCDYVEDKKHGEEKGKGIYGRDNIATLHWNENVLNGSYKLTDEEGNIIEEGNFLNGYAIGYWKSYYPGNKLKSELWYSSPTKADSNIAVPYSKSLHATKTQFPDSARNYEKDGRLESVERRNVDFSYSIIHYVPQPPKGAIQIIEDKTSTPPVMFAEVPPEFPGGEDALLKFIQKNLQYPRQPMERNLYGTVYIRFVVDKDGTVKDAEVIKSAHPTLDKEAMRVVRMMPKWSPGKIDGKNVAVTYNLPIRFNL